MHNILAVIFIIVIGLLMLGTIGVAAYVLWLIASFAGIGVLCVGLLWFVISAITDKS